MIPMYISVIRKMTETESECHFVSIIMNSKSLLGEYDLTHLLHLRHFYV